MTKKTPLTDFLLANGPLKLRPAPAKHVVQIMRMKWAPDGGAPLIESFVRPLQCSGDPFALEIDELTALVNEQYPVSAEPGEGWTDWGVTALADRSQAEPPPGLELDLDTPAGSFIVQSLKAYPTMFKTDTFSHWRVLAHALTMPANGMSWSRNGTLSYPPIFPLVGNGAQDSVPVEPPGFEQIAATTRPVPFGLPRGRGLPHEAELLSSMPANVEQSWLQAAEEFCSYLLGRPAWELASPGFDSDPVSLRAAISEGLVVREQIQAIYARMHQGPLGEKLAQAGRPPQDFSQADTSMPARMENLTARRMESRRERGG